MFVVFRYVGIDQEPRGKGSGSVVLVSEPVLLFGSDTSTLSTETDHFPPPLCLGYEVLRLVLPNVGEFLAPWADYSIVCVGRWDFCVRFGPGGDVEVFETRYLPRGISRRDIWCHSTAVLVYGAKTSRSQRMSASTTTPAPGRGARVRCMMYAR